MFRRTRPANRRGTDDARQVLADRPYGLWLLGTLVVGLVPFGLSGSPRGQNADCRWVIRSFSRSTKRQPAHPGQYDEPE